MLLIQEGFETIEAPDCESAIRMATSERPDCAIIDLRFPNKESGLRTVRELKALDPAMHVFLLTGDRSERLALLPEAALVDEILLKASSSAKLIGRLKSIRKDRIQTL